MDVAELSGRLLAVADQLRGLSVSRRDPEAFFTRRSEIQFDLRRIARELDSAAHGPQQRPERRSERLKVEPGLVADRRGRAVRVELRPPRRRTV